MILGLTGSCYARLLSDNLSMTISIPSANYPIMATGSGHLVAQSSKSFLRKSTFTWADQYNLANSRNVDFLKFALIFL